jgi:hypothetical protein
MLLAVIFAFIGWMLVTPSGRLFLLILIVAALLSDHHG